MKIPTKYVIGILVAVAAAAIAVNLIFFDKGPQPAAKPAANTHVTVVTDQTFLKEVMESTVPVIIDFHADWCGPCQQFKPVFEKVSGDYAGKVKFVSINVDDNPDVADLFGITSIPATIFLRPDANGTISAGGAKGALSEAQLKQVIDKCLDPATKLVPLFEKKKPGQPAQPAQPAQPTKDAPKNDAAPKNNATPKMEAAPKNAPKSDGKPNQN
ncbi:MAG: thioredoxin family protein [Candidatus Obscuribacterales bacterium]|nr:thioredoxin family protein [Candidatus Obscuribacterales bacterium]